MFALVSGEYLLSALFELCIWGVILWILWWGLNKIAPAEPFMKIATFILVILTVVVLINILLGINGHRFITW